MAQTFEQATLSLTGTGPRVEGALNDEMRRLADITQQRVLRDWPVDTGESKRGFTVLATPNGADIINRVAHTFFVKHGLADSLIQTSLNDLERNTVSRLETDVTFILEQG